MTKFGNPPHGTGTDYTECSAVISVGSDPVLVGDLVALNFNATGTTVDDTVPPGGKNSMLSVCIAASTAGTVDKVMTQGILGIALTRGDVGDTVRLCLRGIVRAKVGRSTGTGAIATGSSLYINKTAYLDANQSGTGVAVDGARMSGLFLDADTGVVVADTAYGPYWVYFEGVSGRNGVPGDQLP